MLLWSFAGIPLGVYNIAQNLNIALQIQPQLLTVLSLITWGQCLYYKKVCFFLITMEIAAEIEQKYSLRKVIYVLSVMAVFLGGLEVALIFALKVSLFDSLLNFRENMMKVRLTGRKRTPEA
jgi:hypothetical protein